MLQPREKIWWIHRSVKEVTRPYFQQSTRMVGEGNQAIKNMSHRETSLELAERRIDPFAEVSPCWAEPCSNPPCACNRNSPNWVEMFGSSTITTKLVRATLSFTFFLNMVMQTTSLLTTFERFYVSLESELTLTWTSHWKVGFHR